MNGQQGALALLIGANTPICTSSPLCNLDRPPLLHRRAGNQPIGTVLRHGQIERESQQTGHRRIGMVQQQVPGPDGTSAASTLPANNMTQHNQILIIAHLPAIHSL